MLVIIRVDEVINTKIEKLDLQTMRVTNEACASVGTTKESRQDVTWTDGY